MSGTRADGSFDVEFTLPAGAGTGDRRLHLNVRDAVGNVAEYSPERLRSLGPAHTVRPGG